MAPRKQVSLSCGICDTCSYRFANWVNNGVLVNGGRNVHASSWIIAICIIALLCASLVLSGGAYIGYNGIRFWRHLKEAGTLRGCDCSPSGPKPKADV